MLPVGSAIGRLSGAETDLKYGAWNIDLDNGKALHDSGVIVRFVRTGKTPRTGMFVALVGPEPDCDKWLGTLSQAPRSDPRGDLARRMLDEAKDVYTLALKASADPYSGW